MNRYSEKVKQMAMAFYGLKFPSKTMYYANNSTALACIDGADRMSTPPGAQTICPLTLVADNVRQLRGGRDFGQLASRAPEENARRKLHVDFLTV